MLDQVHELFSTTANNPYILISTLQLKRRRRRKRNDQIRSRMDRNRANDVGSSSYYSVLGIRNDASFSDVRSAYRKLALKWHPDRWSANPAAAGEAKRRFQKIQEAYSVLSDKGKRSMYDAGFLDLFEEDEGMGDFLHDLMNMMEKNVGAEEESLEDLQKTFVDLFGDDLAEMMQESDDPKVRKKPREAGSNSRATVQMRNASA